MTRGIARLAPWWVLSVTALVAFVLVAAAAPRVWGPGPCRLDWCQPSADATPIDDIDTRLQEAADVARLSEGHDCVPAAKPRPGQIPATMVLRDTSGVVVRVAWTYPAPAGSWVLALCYGPGR